MKVFTSKYKNGVRIEVHYYKKAPKGLHPVDRIKLLIFPSKGKSIGGYMMKEEAVDIIQGLIKALSFLLEDDDKK